MPIDWASRRAGSTVSTTTCRPRSAARRPIAAAAVVLPTPPDPQQTMIRVRRSSISASVSSHGGVAGGFIVRSEDTIARRPPRGHSSGRPLFPQYLGQPVQPAQIDPIGNGRKLVARLPGPGQLTSFTFLQRHAAGVLDQL